MSSSALTTVVPLTDTDRQTALHFAQQQPTRAKAMQVYRNTLAVLATKHCLDLLEVPSDLAAGACWNAFSRLAADVADLCIPKLGCLECRPVNVNDQYGDVPSEVWENRLGYLLIQLDAFYQEATMLGFAASVKHERLTLAQLQPLEALLLHVAWLKEQPPAAQPAVAPSMNHLHQWLNEKWLSETWLSETIGAMSDPWQPIDAFVGRLHEPSFAFRSLREIALDVPERIQQMLERLQTWQRFGESRSEVSALRADHALQTALVQLIETTADEETRWKAAELLWAIDSGHPATGVRRVLDLGLLLASCHLALMVAVMQVADQRLAVLARVYPLAEQDCLPAGLQLAVLGADGNLALETQARERDNYIQLKLRGVLGEQFSLRLHLGQDVLTEHFVL